ncbi:MAG: hypothetical protein E7389_05470 [Ruminococcaceae bacterium]|nr:hypothetical protein [Oscillospiraceae bacterium]
MNKSYKDKSFGQTYKINQPEFWKNLWFYEGKVIIISVIVLVILIWSIVGCIRTIEPDVSVIFSVHYPTPYEEIEAINSILSEKVEDVNGDKKNVAEIMEIYLPNNTADEFYMANSVKLTAELSSGNADIIIGEEDILRNIYPFDILKEIKSSDEVPEKGGVYADITGTKLAEIFKYKGEGKLYLILKEAPEKQKKLDAFGESVKLAKTMLDF